MTLHAPQAVLFDLDGTLIDTAPDFAGVLNRQLVAHGRRPLPYEAVRSVVSQGARAVVTLGFGDRFPADSDEFEAIRQEFLASYLQHLADETRLFPGMDELLTALESRGTPWGIVTNKPEGLAAALMPLLGWEQRCAVLIGGDTLAVRKPDPLPLLVAAERIGVAPRECVYVGDDERDIVAARAAGMPSIVALWGYRLAEDDPQAWGGDVLVDDPRRLHHADAWPSPP